MNSEIDEKVPGAGSNPPEATVQIGQFEKTVGADVRGDASASPAEPEAGGSDETPEPDVFPREYVEKLRDENAKYRQRAGRVDEYAQRLHTALVAATGKLADPTDLPFDEAHLEDETALAEAVQDLLARKPHLASRLPSGDIGQGMSVVPSTVNLAGILRAAAN
ncbi:hypothetical protein USB125703_02054 [Pseudoclavibacter triregionum]|nr:hypothetical protein USB125703_02054 [Pseudoclavibacter triregionum]